MALRPSRTEYAVGLTLLAVLVVGCLLVMRPFLTSLLWAVILSYSTWPLYQRLLRRLGGNEFWAALSMTLLVAMVLVVPLAFLGATLAQHVASVAEVVRELLAQGIPEPAPWVDKIPLISTEVRRYWEALAHEGTTYLSAIGPYIGQARVWALQSGATLGRGVLELALSVLVCFFVYRDGQLAADRLHTAAGRFAGARARHLLDVAGSTTKSVVYGIIGTAIAQAAMAAIGFWIAGVPGTLLLGFLTFVLSLIPGGPPLVWVPVTIWLLYTGEPGWAIFMAIWGFFSISGIDNIVRPYLISRESRLPLLLVFLGVIGGVLAFGFIGIFLGPTLLALGFTLLMEWTMGGRKAPESLPAAKAGPEPPAPSSNEP
ncbi:MAG TPA: AI-2E family transporter [Hypericibacter adhaerens]|jgi:predicted PurR-regulated permease PerM|uniref:AI-2E family transporter n=1 Tax=Hypericibacter adhaerens TaxID=2602016 RepID=UPI002C06CBDE|nr:AI-2E family transporter [Hypericibacter adhaerens]HWA46033.1 AI-2E family transporter [Hypericibacter adhaerens]